MKGPDRKTFLCPVSGCHKVFYSTSNLKAHNRTHTGERPYECSDCSKAFTTIGNLRTHQLIHLDLRPFACKVSGCGQRFRQAVNLRAHQRTHTKEKPYTCLVSGCGRVFTALSSVRRHLRNCHSKDARKSQPGVLYHEDAAAVKRAGEDCGHDGDDDLDEEDDEEDEEDDSSTATTTTAMGRVAVPSSPCYLHFPHHQPHLHPHHRHHQLLNLVQLQQQQPGYFAFGNAAPPASMVSRVNPASSLSAQNSPSFKDESESEIDTAYYSPSGASSWSPSSSRKSSVMSEDGGAISNSSSAATELGWSTDMFPHSASESAVAPHRSSELLLRGSSESQTYFDNLDYLVDTAPSHASVGGQVAHHHNLFPFGDSRELRFTSEDDDSFIDMDFKSLQARPYSTLTYDAVRRHDMAILP